MLAVARKFFPILLFFAFVHADAADQRYSVPVDDSPVLGPKNAPVTLIEFIDYQ